MLCSAIFKNGIIGRNLDWLYSEMADCIIKTPTTIGVAGANHDFTKAFAESQIYTQAYHILPFYLQDGFNSDGLFCCTLVTPKIVEKSKPKIETRERICSTMLVRYIIDKFQNIEECIKHLTNYVEIYHPQKLLKMNYNQHWMIADKNRAFVLEITEDGELVTIESKEGILKVTNFHLHNIEFNLDGSVYTPQTQTVNNDAIKTNKIHKFGSGLERYNILNETSISSVKNMKKLMEKLKYTNSYTLNNDEWFTEFVNTGEPPLTCASQISDFKKVMKKIKEDYHYRSRDEKSNYYGYWNTNHGCVYDLNEKKLYISGQENYDNWKEFSL